jgi:hypothetical protein
MALSDVKRCLSSFETEAQYKALKEISAYSSSNFSPEVFNATYSRLEGVGPGFGELLGFFFLPEGDPMVGQWLSDRGLDSSSS